MEGSVRIVSLENRAGSGKLLQKRTVFQRMPAPLKTLGHPAGTVLHLCENALRFHLEAAFMPATNLNAKAFISASSTRLIFGRRLRPRV